MIFQQHWKHNIERWTLGDVVYVLDPLLLLTGLWKLWVTISSLTFRVQKLCRDLIIIHLTGEYIVTVLKYKLSFLSECIAA